MIVRDVLIVVSFLVLLALPSLVGTTAWFAHTVAGMLPTTPGPVMTGTEYVFRHHDELSFSPNGSLDVPAGRVVWSLTCSQTGDRARPLRQVFTFSYVPTGTDGMSTAEIDALVTSQGIDVVGIDPLLAGIEAETVLTSPNGADSFGVINLRPKQRVVLHPMRTLGTLTNLFPWILTTYYGMVVLYGVVGLVMIRTVRAMRRQERGQCVRCGYPLGTTPECTECGLVCSLSMVEPEAIVR